MNEIVRVRVYEKYISIQRKDGHSSIQTPGFETQELIDFLEFCEEKGRVFRQGQSTVYERDPKFETL